MVSILVLSLLVVGYAIVGYGKGTGGYVAAGSLTLVIVLIVLAILRSP